MTGEFNCKVDAKGRLRLPSNLIHQFGGAHQMFTVNRGYEKHLMLYPKEVWDQKTAEMDKLHMHNTKQRQVIRYFYRGATQVAIDASDRILLPKGLVEFAGINKEVVLFAYRDQVEIWSKEGYEEMITNEPDDFSEIADQVFGSDQFVDPSVNG